MKKIILSITLMISCIGLVECNEEQEIINTPPLQEALDKIEVPNMFNFDFGFK